MMHRISSRKGFTLIELMIVIAIIAILAAILVPNFIRARAQGQLTACKSNLKNIGTALEMYATDNGGRYPVTLKKLSEVSSLNNTATQAYLKQIPICPSAGINTYGDAYQYHQNPDNYSLYCEGSNHTAAGMPADYPKFNAEMGLIERESQMTGTDSTATGG